MSKTKKSLPAVVLSVGFSCSLLVAQQVPENLPYKNANLPPERRADDLVQRMTLHEKISQLGHRANAIPRLGVPQYDWWNEGLHGVARAGNATVFPQAIGMAATFDEPLLLQIGDVISTEFRAKYYQALHPDGSSDWYRGLTVWSPNINIFRDPRWGRGQETYGEDPYLTSRLGLAFVNGLQGNDTKYLKTVATPKHFAVHSGPELTRHTVEVKASVHDMEDTYLPAFRTLVMEGKAQSIMCAYNSLNSEPACANTELLKTHLRDAWGFKGYVVSDCGAVADIFSGHHYTKSAEQATAVAFQRGTDLICGVPPEKRVQYEKGALEKAVKDGLLAESVVDQAVRRLFVARFRLGIFDPPEMVPYSQISTSDNDTDSHRQLALRAARESLVLLKNQGSLLPLKKTYRTIAVIGPNADNLDALTGNYNGTPSHPVTILSGIKQRFPESRVLYAEGTGLTGPAPEPIPAQDLFTDSSRKHHGLRAEYFSNPELQGVAVISRTDETINFDRGHLGATSQLVKDFSVRWTGVLVPAKSGNYLLGFTGEAGYRVTLEDKIVVENWTPHHPSTTMTSRLFLKSNHAYVLKVEYFARVRAAEARLIWAIFGKSEKEALQAARSADLIVLAMGLSPRIEGEEMKVEAEGFSGGDRTKIDLPAPQEDLLRRVYAFGKPTILVLLSGSAIAINWADEKIPAILQAWYPGGQGGTAVAEALAGDFSPGGRLPLTFYRSTGQLPAFEDYSMSKRTYRYFQGEALYPFGYGLSYTSFAYRNIQVDRANIAADESVTVSIEVANTGKIAADEVVELYLTHSDVSGAPLRALAGFKRVHLESSEQKTVSFELAGRLLSVVDETGKRRIVPGKIKVWIGGGQPISRPGLSISSGLETDFTITTDATLSD
jgi:beta-glucosidase